VSVVVPVFNERDNVAPLVSGVAGVLRPCSTPFEVIVVDDGSTDGTLRALVGLMPDVPELVVVSLRRNFGQTPALQAGFDRARGEVIVTMDGDLQNDPRDIPRLLEEIERGADIVSGWRRRRQDLLLRRKLPSLVANWIIRCATGVPIHDQGCSLKAYRRRVVEGLDLYADMHRFIAVLAMPMGTSVTEIEVQHHPRVSGVSKYGLWRVFRVLTDLLAIQMLTRFRESPIRWFALLSAPFLLGAFLAALAAFWSEEESLVLATVAVLGGTTFASCILFGLFGEVVTEEASPERASRLVLREWGADT
jgi:glycosyltransferase involved in cell wall biosynthesis